MDIQLRYKKAHSKISLGFRRLNFGNNLKLLESLKSGINFSNKLIFLLLKNSFSYEIKCRPNTQFVPVTAKRI